MTRVRSEIDNKEAIQPDVAEQPNVDAGPALHDGAKIGSERQPREFGQGYYDPSGEAPKKKAPVPVDFSTIISRAESNENSVEACVEAFRGIADLVRACKGPQDCEALALGLDKAGEYVAVAVLKGTPGEGLTGVVGRV